MFCRKNPGRASHNNLFSLDSETSPREENMNEEEGNIIKMNNRDVILKKYLGRGAFGSVYIGLLGFQKVAVKFYRNMQSEKPFLREVDCLSASIHPRVMRIMGFGRIPGTQDFFMVSEYVGSRTMKSLLKDFDYNLYTWEDRERIMLELLQALAHLNKLDICHHDIKPENILISDSGHSYIADFGMSTQPTHSLELRRQGKGTFTYVSPETFEDQMSIESDVWSLGVLFYEWCTHGELPFFGKTECELKTNIKTCPPMEFNPRYKIPQVWQKIILNNMLDKNVRTRWSAQRILDELALNLEERDTMFDSEADSMKSDEEEISTTTTTSAENVNSQTLLENYALKAHVSSLHEMKNDVTSHMHDTTPNTPYNVHPATTFKSALTNNHSSSEIHNNIAHSKREIHHNRTLTSLPGTFSAMGIQNNSNHQHSFTFHVSPSNSYTNNPFSAFESTRPNHSREMSGFRRPNSQMNLQSNECIWKDKKRLMSPEIQASDMDEPIMKKNKPVAEKEFGKMIDSSIDDMIMKSCLGMNK
ncbi:hypothetical protein AKO1_007938 [Acrasis kona]|uniref:Protein kinase domain-containing protein n=1 Tax=Acrasis kona TaxID=1008807 RepID=A0AAW2YQ32_9EUKA